MINSHVQVSIELVQKSLANKGVRIGLKRLTFIQRFEHLEFSVAIENDIISAKILKEKVNLMIMCNDQCQCNNKCH